MKTKEQETLLGYFDILRGYVKNGYLEVMPASGEAYITWAGIHALANTDPELSQIEEIKKTVRPGKHDVMLDIISEKISDKMKVVVRGIFAYIVWLDSNTEGLKLYRQASELAPQTPYSSTAGLQASENIKKLMDASDHIASRMQKKEFALHVVADRHPHDLFYTIIYQRRRNLVLPWKEREHMEVVEYRHSGG